jgi:hypothetical protein
MNAAKVKAAVREYIANEFPGRLPQAASVVIDFGCGSPAEILVVDLMTMNSAISDHCTSACSPHS